MTSAIVTSHYRHKHPPRKPKPRTVEAPAIVAVDPKTRFARRDSRHRDNQGGDQAAAVGQHTRRERKGEAQRSTPRGYPGDHAVTTTGKAPAAASDDGPRTSAITTVRDGKTVQRSASSSRWRS